MKKTILVDLDGTLANIDHRLPLVRKSPPDFDAFYAACGKDTMNTWCRDLILAMQRTGVQVMIVSARPKRTFQATAEWLLSNGIPSNNVALYLLRKDGDYSPDQELKRAWINSGKVVLKKDVLFVVDDRQRVVDMWREEGLVCLQAYAWEEFKRERKQKVPA